ncbi:pyridoxamine 5'-phosphate oxidase family protein [Pseudarthrobacter sp. C4D7]|uniref:pyridoxamine 5'-phosphate oxidase family protein n=1 Tax=Pseudarthrobacter sp. C4D7 TaxID=2735268 RepID=UPI00158497FF|nr:pyridoxamine 5'-phosphate oxidase family protein [Pseudarthrobacter sp. C4D7]NUT70058.1 pyridoxamine 5'-phosphate oxidase family protein [Pseudarthrobacter sp. C4D7]
MHNDPAQLPTEVLDAETCWDLMRGVSVGHLAVLVDGYPEVFPVNYKVDQRSVLFRTGEGTKLRAAGGPFAVALEADGHDDTQAWSVLVKGKALVLDPSDELLAGAGLTLFPWQAGEKDHFVRIVPTSISGRRFTITSPLTWWNHVAAPAGKNTA